MIKQLSVTTVTGTTTLTYAQLGDIVTNASGAIDLTLPDPLPGLWYRITNNTANTVTVKTSSATLASIAQNEFVLCLANGTSGWFFAKSGGQLTKAAIEAVLTGEITSHTHAYAPSPIISSSAPTTSTTGVLGQLYIETATPTIYYCSAITGSVYTWTELSGGGSGTSVTVPIKGLYATLVDLETAHPTGDEGDAYAVGTAEENEIYIWDVDAEEWVSVGPLKGVGDAEDIAYDNSSTGMTATDVQAAIDELFTSGSDGKAALETAIETKGGTVDKAGAVATFAELEDGIDSIPSSGTPLIRYKGHIDPVFLSDTSVSLTIPSYVEAGDTIVICCLVRNTSTPTITSGYTLAASVQCASTEQLQYTQIYYKTALSTDASSTVTITHLVSTVIGASLIILQSTGAITVDDYATVASDAGYPTPYPTSSEDGTVAVVCSTNVYGYTTSKTYTITGDFWIKCSNGNVLNNRLAASICHTNQGIMPTATINSTGATAYCGNVAVIFKVA